MARFGRDGFDSGGSSGGMVVVCGADAGEAGAVVGGGGGGGRQREWDGGDGDVGCDQCLWGVGVLGGARRIGVGEIEGAADDSWAERVSTNWEFDGNGWVGAPAARGARGAVERDGADGAELRGDAGGDCEPSAHRARDSAKLGICGSPA